MNDQGSDRDNLRKQVGAAFKEVLGKHGLELVECGSKTFTLKKFDPVTGFWADPPDVTNKPPRWVVWIERGTDGVQARVPDADRADRLAFANTANRSVGALCVRVVPAIRRATAEWVIHDHWEWTLFFGFGKALERGSSGQLFEGFTPISGRIRYMDADQAYVIAGLVSLCNPADAFPLGPEGAGAVTYKEATDALRKLIRVPASAAGKATNGDHVEVPLYDAFGGAGVAAAAAALDAAFGTAQRERATEPREPIHIEPFPGLIGVEVSVYRHVEAALRSGKRHVMLYGPPGTGKTTFAQRLAGYLSESYCMITGSADWTSQDIIGGYQPTGSGGIRFVPGVLLQNFDRPLVIDELNRCDIDKVIGPLFTVLSGQPTTLPYSTDPTDSSSARYVILPEQRGERRPHEFAPTDDWRIIATINTMDKASLYQMSYALARRFAWILIDVPEDRHEFVDRYAVAQGIAAEAGASRRSALATMWDAVLAVRAIGPAPFIDILRMLRGGDPAFDPFAGVTDTNRDLYWGGFEVAVLPMLDGILRDDAEKLVDLLSAVLGGGETWKTRIARRLGGVSL